MDTECARCDEYCHCTNKVDGYYLCYGCWIDLGNYKETWEVPMTREEMKEKIEYFVKHRKMTLDRADDHDGLEQMFKELTDE